MVEKGPNWYERYNASHIVTVCVEILDAPGTLATVLAAIAEQSTNIGNIRVVGAVGQYKVREIQLFFVDDEHKDRVLEALRRLPPIRALSVTDEVLEIHRHGTIETKARVRLDTLMDLRMVYTPGVASVCEMIAKTPSTAWDYTALGQKIAIVTNGTAVLGLGNIGPLAALPVMEGKSAILSRFVGISAEPLLIESDNVDEIVNTVVKTSAGYGAIQLEDIAAPACFEIEQELQARLEKPVFHDDQHGTATVCVAGLINAMARLDRDPNTCKAVILGAGAAGSAIAKFLAHFGIKDVVVCDSVGAIYKGREERMNRWKSALAELTNPSGSKGTIKEIIRGRDLFIGVSRPNAVSKEMIQSMSDKPIVFALANPVSEISMDDAMRAGAGIAVDGRAMNNALAYPGIFKGALEARATSITQEMMLAAANALARSAPKDTLLPSMLDPKVHQAVAQAVKEAWHGRAA